MVAPEIERASDTLEAWLRQRDYAGYEPYDILNAPLLRGSWARRQPFATALIQTAKRVGGLGLRSALRVPASKNPKALALIVLAYCDLARLGRDTERDVAYLISELLRLRSAVESEHAWGYDWDYVSLRGTRLPAFSPNAIATYFVATAMLEVADVFGNSEAAAIARSAGAFCVTRLAHSVDTPSDLCFSYTPDDRTRIYNSSALTAALLARLGASGGPPEYLALARRAMTYIARQQLADGSWHYGAARRQRWIDGFHTAYNLDALDIYRRATGDGGFDSVISRGYRFYKDRFFEADSAPKYFHDRLYPIDIHSCSQAILTFCQFAPTDPEADARAVRVARWTLTNMRSAEGTFYYQRHRLYVDRTPYVRWGQAWMLHALARLRVRMSRRS